MQSLLPSMPGVDLARADAGHQLVEPLALLVRDVPERAADHLLRGPAEHPLGGGIPERDPVVEVDLEHGHRRGFDRRAQPLLARAEIVLAPLPLGHVDTAHEHALAAEDVHDRRRRPLDHADAARSRDPAREAELRVDAVERRGDPDRGEVAVVLVEELAEAAAAHLHRPLQPITFDERLVDGVLDHLRLVVDDDEQARRDVGHLAEEVALAVELDLVLLALGHVEAAADDVADVAGLVQERRGRPRDHHLLAAPVDERVLPGGRRDGPGFFSKRSRTSSRSRRRDEDVPEVLVADVLDVLVAARALAGRVVVGDPPIRVERHQQRRRRVDDRLEEDELRPHLGLQPFVLEPERRRRRDRVDELGLVRERGVVDERADELAVPPHVVPQADAVVAGERGAVGQDELLALGQPVDEVERRVAEGVGERVPQRNTAAELDEQVGDAAAREAAAEDAGEERHRHERERDEEDVVQRLGGVLGDRAHDQLDEQDDHHERAGAENGAERPAEGALGADEAGDDDREHDDARARARAR